MAWVLKSQLSIRNTQFVMEDVLASGFVPRDKQIFSLKTIAQKQPIAKSACRTASWAPRTLFTAIQGQIDRCIFSGNLRSSHLHLGKHQIEQSYCTCCKNNIVLLSRIYRIRLGLQLYPICEKKTAIDSTQLGKKKGAFKKSLKGKSGSFLKKGLQFTKKLKR